MSESYKHTIISGNNCKKKRRRRAKFIKKAPVVPNPSVPTVKTKVIHKRTFVNRQTIKPLNRHELIDQYVPHNLHYLLFAQDSPFNLKALKSDSSIKSEDGVVFIPNPFSLCDNPDATIDALRIIVKAFFVEQGHPRVLFDYSGCHSIGIETQALMDVILSEYRKFLHKCANKPRLLAIETFPGGFGGRNMVDKDLQKLMFSVGSPANLGIRKKDFEDVLELPMRSHNALTKHDRESIIIQKEIDTTEIVDHVIACLGKMNKTLTPDKKNDLSTVVGEILINAEEHSTLRHRFSMAFFREQSLEGKHFGLFRFVILNFGATIYEKFSKNEECPPAIIEKMRALSKQYTKHNFFKDNVFEEETLWTLYALQQGVTSVPGKRRGSGTIQFIRSFFNIKGSPDADNVSKMVILSGNTEIIFDGKYGITEKIEGQKRFNMMTFNSSGNIEEMPDKNYVRRSKHFFPGTIITANILLNDDDIEELNTYNNGRY